ncbi:MAG: hypothetical protein P1U65_17955 [Minwuia sp.]|nr:hypothetical protein [Minwuia sp.]
MSGNKIHYEVLGQRGTSWTIIAVVDGQEEALEAARQARSSYRAVKVMRERFDKSSGTFRSGQIFFSGAKMRTSKYDSDPIPGICWKVEDLYSYEGRRSINRLLRSELVRWGLTATELIHSLDYVERLQDDGTAMQRAVQQTSIAQVRETGQGVQERIKQIYEIIDRGIVALRRDKQMAGELRLVDNDLDALIAEITPKESRTYLLNVALVNHLASAQGYGEKLGRVLGPVRADHPDWVHEVADTFVGDLLSLGNVAHRLIGERETLYDELSATALLAHGRLPAEDPLAAPEAHTVNRLIAAGKMSHARQSLEQHLIEALRSPRKLVDGDIRAEARAVHDLTAKLKREDGSWLGGTRVMELASARGTRWLHPEAIAEYLHGAEEPDARAMRLIDLEPYILGAANKRKLGEFLLPILTSAQAEAYFTEGDIPVSERMKHLATIQKSVLAADLQDLHQRRLSERLDDLCCRLLQKRQLFKRLLAGNNSVADKCIGLLKMVLEGYFTVGKAEDEARQLVRKLLLNSEFRASFFAGIDSKEEKISRLETLTAMLARADIEFAPRSADPATPAEAEASSA